MKVRLLLLCLGSGLLGSAAAHAQTVAPPRYRNLVMEGGGIQWIQHTFFFDEKMTSLFE